MFGGKIQLINGNEEMNNVAKSIETMIGEPVTKEFDISLLKKGVKGIPLISLSSVSYI